MTLVLGVDPGVTGGVALLDGAGVIRFAQAMPIIRNAVNRLDTDQLRDWLRAAAGAPVMAFVERAQSMPRQGVSSAFNYGCMFGSILTGLSDLEVGFELVQAAKWKRDLNLSSDKVEAIDRVRQLYPRLPLKRKDDGVAEAILIARWGLRQLVPVGGA